MKLPGTHRHARIAVGLHSSPEFRAGYDKAFRNSTPKPWCAAMQARRGKLYRCTLCKGHVGEHMWEPDDA
jgi:hypothetical protein